MIKTEGTKIIIRNINTNAMELTISNELEQPFTFHDNLILWEIVEQYKGWLQPTSTSWKIIAEDYNNLHHNKPKRSVEALRVQYQRLENEYEESTFGSVEEFNLKISRLNYYTIKKNYLEEKMKKEMEYLEERNRMFSIYMQERLKLEKREFSLRRNLLIEKHRMKMMKMDRERTRYRITACNMIIELDKDAYDELSIKPRRHRRSELNNNMIEVPPVVKIKKYRMQQT